MWRIFLLSLVVLEQSWVSVAATCELEGVPENSAAKPYRLPSISDTIEEGLAWTSKITSQLTRIGFFVHPGYNHIEYLSANFSGNEYFLWANEITTEFTRREQTRLMARTMVLTCMDSGKEIKRYYYLHIPVDDETPPKFQDSTYTFDVSKDKVSKGRPLSYGQFVVVGDNSYELQAPGESLTFAASPDIINLKIHKLWVQPNPSTFFYRLDVYLNDEQTLEPNTQIQIQLTASDKAGKSGSTNIILNVSD